MASKAEVIQKMVEPVIRALGYQLWGIEYLGQGRHTMLRIYLDKEGGIDIEDCAEASRHISSILDVEDPIKEEYTLEVSSPGMDRMLFTPEQYRRYVGSKIKLRLTGNAGGRRNYTGQLIELVGKDDELAVVVVVDGQPVNLAWSTIEKANLVIED